MVVEALEHVEELPAEEPAENTHGEEEALAAGDPAAAVRGQPAAWDHAVEVRVVTNGLAPGVEHREEADLGPQVLRVPGDGRERLPSGTKEQAVELTFDGRVLCCGRYHPGLGRDHQLSSGLEFLAMLVPHVTLRHECRIHTYGAVSTRIRKELGWILSTRP